MMGRAVHDYDVMVGFADTLLRLKLVWSYSKYSSKTSSYIAVCNLGQIYWMRYRERHGAI